MTLLRELRENTDRLFQQNESELLETLSYENVVKLIGQDELSEGSTRRFLIEALDQYLGIVEPLAEYAKRHLAERWLFRFGAIIKSEEGTPAWRACQQLWQTCLATRYT